MPAFPGNPGRWRRSLRLLLLAAAIAPAAASAQSGTGATKRRSACADCESEVRRSRALERLDSLRWEFEHEKLSDAERERLRKEMAVAIRELQAAIGDLRVEMGDMERAQAEVWAAAPRVAYAYTTRPTGYLGVSFDGPNTEAFRGDERIIRFYAYPKIALVEPSSPAERAGIRAGDTLLAMNGLDVVEREISLTKLLVPDDELLVKLRREGATRDYRVTVGRAPAYVAMRMRPPAAPAPLDAPGAVSQVRTPRPARSPRAPMVAPEQATTMNVWVYSDGVAGAKVETVTDGLGRALGVKGGILVVRAGPGTPANRAGLRDGDVIVRAAGTTVNTVRELRTALERHDDGEGVKLVIIRERKQRELTLRQ